MELKRVALSAALSSLDVVKDACMDGVKQEWDTQRKENDQVVVA